MESHRNKTTLAIQVPVPRSFSPQGKPKNIRNIVISAGSIVSHGTTSSGGIYMATVCSAIVGLEPCDDPGQNVDS